jgi:hypothetical protein
MRVFLSWSGKRSQYVAEQFSEWLPVVVQGVETFMSEHDVEAGSRWAREIDEQLEATDFGVLFVTPENQHEPWLVHEAGALGKSIEESRVVPMLIDMGPSDLDWPLARFQAKELGEDGVRDLVDSVNEAHGEDRRDADVLEKAFDGQWTDLESNLENIPPPEDESSSEEDTSEEAQKKRDEKVDELLELVRGMSRTGGVEDLFEKTLNRFDKLESRIIAPPNWPGSPRSSSLSAPSPAGPHLSVTDIWLNPWEVGTREEIMEIVDRQDQEHPVMHRKLEQDLSRSTDEWSLYSKKDGPTAPLRLKGQANLQCSGPFDSQLKSVQHRFAVEGRPLPHPPDAGPMGFELAPGQEFNATFEVSIPDQDYGEGELLYGLRVVYEDEKGKSSYLEVFSWYHFEEDKFFQDLNNVDYFEDIKGDIWQ